MMRKLLLLSVFTLLSLNAQVNKGDDIAVPYIPYEIKMGQGFGEVQANCLTCHSFGYIINQGPQSKAFWAGKTQKMIHHFKAPISKEDAVIINEYLFKHYGNGKLK